MTEVLHRLSPWVVAVLVGLVVLAVLVLAVLGLLAERASQPGPEAEWLAGLPAVRDEHARDVARARQLARQLDAPTTTEEVPGDHQ
ncbi:hypothetical protein [Umezawaea beigongshangensis]|uniref:hypothetical protein n=1 Tax=Umezawaea beigongshangensis TaxID=2780383 RepID=UPI0018F25F30|nr:hypothetical protein [Umezawaea beigongshangensis]